MMFVKIYIYIVLYRDNESGKLNTTITVDDRYETNTYNSAKLIQ